MHVSIFFRPLFFFYMWLMYTSHSNLLDFLQVHDIIKCWGSNIHILDGCFGDTWMYDTSATFVGEFGHRWSTCNSSWFQPCWCWYYAEATSKKWRCSYKYLGSFPLPSKFSSKSLQFYPWLSVSYDTCGLYLNSIQIWTHILWMPMSVVNSLSYFNHILMFLAGNWFLCGNCNSWHFCLVVHTSIFSWHESC
jgi:hypothetical protein